MTVDWLDSVLSSRAIADDGFAERVIAVGQAQRRTQLLLRIVVLALALGAITAYGAGVVLSAAERWGSAVALFDDKERWLDRQRGDFRAVLVALDERPALQRRAGRDAAPLLDVISRELGDQGSARAPACAGELSGGKRFDVTQSACDTSFIDGLVAYDEWRATREQDDVSAFGEPLVRFDAIVRTHLRRAAAADDAGRRFSLAADDSVALGRLLLGHSFTGAMVLRTVAEETALAGERAGGFVAPLSVEEAQQAVAVWMAAVAYGSASGSAEDVAFLREHERSVLSCGLRADALAGELAMQEHYVSEELRQRNGSWSSEGCAPRASGAEPWRLFGDEPTTGTKLAALVSQLPGARAILARIVTTPPMNLEIKRQVR